MAAYDGYHNQPDPQQPPYPSSHDQTYDQSHDPGVYHSTYADARYHEASHSRSRASSNAQFDNPQQPLYNALHNAFDKSDAARTVDPDLIAQITAEVKKSVLDEIKLHGAFNGAGVAQPHPAPAPPHVPQSPSSASASFPSRNVYTPPSPKHYDYSGHSHGSISPDPLTQDPTFEISGEIPIPRDHSKNAPGDPQHDRIPQPRPPPISRMSQEFTPIEKMWQHLFDPQGQPLPRLGQFLRGLAIHLIDDYDPKKSLVITPSKMLQFYNNVKLSDEIYPWQTIFRKLPYPTLSKIYRELRCEHHLVQEHLTDAPCVPALTPKGFEVWMSAMIQAYPDTEYERLSKAVLDMPISNADDAKERFPKELPRRLFPSQENLQAQQRCAAVLCAEGVGPLRRVPTFPPPPPSGPPPNLERERSPYAARQDSKVIESDDDSPLSMPLERERKPYSSIPGGGKVHDDDLSQSLHSNSSSYDQRSRTQSTASQGQWASSQHPRTWSQANTDRRPRSPSFTNYGTRSDPNVRDMPGGYQPARFYESEEENRRLAKEAEMKRNDWARRQVEDESSFGGHHRRSTTGTESSYDSQPRSIYDDDNYKGRSGSNGYDPRSYEPRRY